ncbi:hypothetical protein AVEN_176856-1 [Araneus ventricosus]|uniref:Uncharacterized protein n=1 Tax=Araneus ventricosus TaxID=182803 RepID=A0A4Y2V684_ARAVE|nr:hypothetical protein AVEN_112339-1 [Araneus ventricosus]GBO20807.1 hypothetical protein AVEN_176856-1 [Araneus ventricosus]
MFGFSFVAIDHKTEIRSWVRDSEPLSQKRNPQKGGGGVKRSRESVRGGGVGTLALEGGSGRLCLLYRASMTDHLNGWAEYWNCLVRRAPNDVERTNRECPVLD